MNPKVDFYLSKLKKWREESEQLRDILLSCGLTEELKWGKPCYVSEGTNIVIIQAFKEYFALGFFNGAVLKDPNGILVKAGENTQAGRQMRFTGVQEILKMKPVLKAYILEAVEAEKAGLKDNTKKTTEFLIIEELKNKFNENHVLRNAFESLTPGRQRAYNIYFSAPKQSQTREARIEKYTQRILSGKGINDCVCGHSKRLPNCDGSHKNIL